MSEINAAPINELTINEGPLLVEGLVFQALTIPSVAQVFDAAMSTQFVAATFESSQVFPAFWFGTDTVLSGFRICVVEESKCVAPDSGLPITSVGKPIDESLAVTLDFSHVLQSGESLTQISYTLTQDPDLLTPVYVEADALSPNGFEYEIRFAGGVAYEDVWIDILGITPDNQYPARFRLRVFEDANG